nr:MAG TPA: hypothetical protein [Inoviridae sp.]
MNPRSGSILRFFVKSSIRYYVLNYIKFLKYIKYIFNVFIDIY